MPNPNYFSGSPEDRAGLKTQLDALYTEARTGALFSLFGNAALFQAFEYEGAQPLELRHNGGEGSLQTIDVVRYRRFQDIQAPGPHFIWPDYSSTLFDLSAMPHALNLPPEEAGQTIPVETAALRLQTRSISEATKVRTFKVGTQMLLQGILVATQDPTLRAVFAEEYTKQQQALTEITEFAETIRDTHPGEFLSPELEAPFLEVQEAYRQHKGA